MTYQRRQGKAFLWVGFIAVLAMVQPGEAYDGSRVFKSIVCPGMGQLGDGQTVKGLAFMATEIVALTFTFQTLSRANSYAHNTRALQTYFSMGGEYASVAKTRQDWQDSYDQAEQARQVMLLSAGLAVACWGLNIADAILFPPRESSDEVTLLGDIAHRTEIGFDPDGTSRIRVSFDW